MSGNANEVVAKFRAELRAKLEKVVAKSVAGALADTVMRTPVDTGRLRNGWAVGVNTERGADGSADKGVSALESVKIGDSVYITNNVPYAPFIENGTARMAPQPMVDPVRRQWQRIVDRAVLLITGGKNVG